MTKKDFAKLVSWRKPFYKRLFCKHIYQGYNASGLLGTYGEYHTKVCKKCGKVKYDPVFWEYEGMGFK